jgi:catechol 2,3-dioxygenase-like lactoylglutathione lyase family enzyme
VSGSANLALGISVADVDARVRALEAAGVRVVSQPRDVAGRWRTAVVEDPWGVRLELVQDPALAGLHHVTLRAADPEAAREWYIERFGGSRISVGDVPAVRYEVMMLLFERGADETLVPGYGINHIGWSAGAIDPFAARLRSLGVEFTTEPRTNLNAYGHRVAFLQGPSAVRIEVVEHTRCAFTEAQP